MPTRSPEEISRRKARYALWYTEMKYNYHRESKLWAQRKDAHYITKKDHMRKRKELGLAAEDVKSDWLSKKRAIIRDLALDPEEFSDIVEVLSHENGRRPVMRMRQAKEAATICVQKGRRGQRTTKRHMASILYYILLLNYGIYYMRERHAEWVVAERVPDGVVDYVAAHNDIVWIHASTTTHEIPTQVCCCCVEPLSVSVGDQKCSFRSVVK